MILTTLLLAAFLAWQDPTPAKQIVDGAEVTVCGKVDRVHTGNPSKCDTTLRIRHDGELMSVTIPASLRPSLAIAPERLWGAEGCFTGRMSVKGETFAGRTIRLNVEQASQVQINVEPPAFGAEAVTLCEASVRTPEVVSEPKPQYSQEAMRKLVQGTVELEAVVSVDGRVSAVRVVSSLHPDLDDNAVSAVRQWRFRPGTLEGRPLPVLVTIEMTFTLGDKPRR